LMRLHNARCSLRCAFDVCGLRDKHGRGNVPAFANKNAKTASAQK